MIKTSRCEIASRDQALTSSVGRFRCPASKASSRWSVRLCAALLIAVHSFPHWATAQRVERLPSEHWDMAAWDVAADDWTDGDAQRISCASMPPASCGCPTCALGPRWYAQADAVFLQRSRAQELLVAALAPQNGPPIAMLTTDDFRFDFEAGMRLTAGGLIGDVTSVEVSYLGLQFWRSEAGIVDPSGNLAAGLGPEIFGVEIANRTKFHNAELNFRRQAMPRGRFSFATLAGVRYLRLSDQFMLAQQLVDPQDGPPGRFDIKTGNDLIGAQLGGEALWNLSPRLRLGATGKAGLFLNLADMDAVLGDFDPGEFRVGARDERLSGLVEVGATATFRVTPNLALRGGYHVIYVSGLALASENMDLFGLLLAPQVKTGGDLVLTGPSAGFELTW